MNKKIFLLFLLFLLTPCVLSFSITREFSNNRANVNENVIVKLIVTTSPGDEVYVIREEIPKDIDVIAPGDGSFNQGKMLWVVMDNINDVNHTYTIKGLKEGNYNFTGIYSLNGKDELSIGGNSILTLIGTVPFCGDNICNSNESCSTCSEDCGACSTSLESSASSTTSGTSGGGSDRENSNLFPSSNESSTNLNESLTASLNKTGASNNTENAKENILGEEDKTKTSNIIFWEIFTLLLISVIIVIYFITKSLKSKSQFKHHNKNRSPTRTGN